MGNTSKGIYYPDPGTIPRRQNLEDLAKTADAAIPQVQAGLFEFTTSEGGDGLWYVDFPETFDSPPVVTANVNSGSGSFRNVTVRVDSFTTTNFRLLISDAASGSTTATVSWIAVQVM